MILFSTGSSSPEAVSAGDSGRSEKGRGVSAAVPPLGVWSVPSPKQGAQKPEEGVRFFDTEVTG